MEIIPIKVLPADAERGCVNITREYLSPEGLECKEIYNIERESDYTNEKKYRISPDNGKTWGEWQNLNTDSLSKMYGDDELIFANTDWLWNPVHKHYVSTYWTRYFLGGHKEAYRGYWQQGLNTFLDHQYIDIKDSDGNFVSRKLVKYEDGVDFDENDPKNPEFLYKNCGYINAPTVLSNGDIAVPVGIPIKTACEIAGLDVNEVFPSCYAIHRSVMVAVGKFNKEKNEYDFTFSNPVILNDLQSSRGIDEPIVTELSSGRLILVMRGSNVQSANWKTRIASGTPTYKWFASSDDGGKTFTEAKPWEFNDGAPIYSAATISSFIRSTRNGRLYWVGNISDEKAYGNFPRFPLYIAEVDDKVGCLKKETLTVIDTRREGETAKVQLSNFSLYEDRETLDFELCLAKIGQFDADHPFIGESWKYIIKL